MKTETKRNLVSTVGLAAKGQLEIAARAGMLRDVPATREMIASLGSYLMGSPRPLLEGQTIGYGCWLLQARQDGSRLLLGEFEPRSELYSEVVRIAPRLHRDQLRVCRENGLAFDPPAFHQKVVVSEGVAKGMRPVAGVRYSGSARASGWYLTTDDYDGDITTLRGLHLWHLVDQWDLIRLLACPKGTRFVIDDNDISMRVDAKILAEGNGDS